MHSGPTWLSLLSCGFRNERTAGVMAGGSRGSEASCNPETGEHETLCYRRNLYPCTSALSPPVSFHALRSETLATQNYELFRQAILEGKQVLFTYKGHRRETCPHVIGTKSGLEKVLTFQFAGGSSTGLPEGGEWRCLFISEASDVELRDGDWHSGQVKGVRPQSCVDEVDVEILLDDDGDYTPYIQRA